jgi:hypothetical protein
MDIGLISECVVGATLIYAGVLSLPGAPYAGSTMVVIGAVLIAYPVWKTVLRFRGTSKGPLEFGARGGKGRKKTHLKVVKSNKEERKTYH